MKNNIKIFMEDCVLTANKMYFFSKDWNALYALNLDSKKTKFISIMPEEKILAKRLCAGIIYYKKKLILIPMTAKKIWIYDLKRAKWTGLERKKMDSAGTHMEIFRAIKYKKKLFLVGSNYPSIIRMDMDTYELNYISEPYDFLKPLKNDEEGYFRSDFMLKDNRLFLASCLNNYILCLNLDTFDYKWSKVGAENFRYSGIAWDGKYYWLSPRTGTPIVKWNGVNEMEYFPLPKEFNRTMYNFLGVQYINGTLFFPGLLQNKMILIDSCYPHKMKICEGQYLFYRCCEKKYIVSQRIDGLLKVEYLPKGKQYEMYCEISSDEFINYFKNNINYQREINEIQIEFSPSSLMEYMSLVGIKWKGTRKKSEIGVNIWKAAMN